jgi:hypothetical protein
VCRSDGACGFDAVTVEVSASDLKAMLRAAADGKLPTTGKEEEEELWI